MAGNTTMRAVLFSGVPYNMTVVDVPRPTIQNATDAIVRITTAAICGTDLHTYHGTYGTQGAPWTMGHEGIGYISEVGDSVQFLSVGDYVVIPDQADDGHLAMSPTQYNAFGSGTGLGGTQAEFVRVPFADDSLIPVPLQTNATNSSLEWSYLFLSDIFATGWTGLDFAGFEPGDSVAIFGAGPVGLLAAYSAVIRGASRVYSVDHVAERLQLAASIGAIPINFRESDPVAQILSQEPDGVTRSVDCVGYEAVNRDLQPQENVILDDMIAVTATGGGVGQIGVFTGSSNSSGIVPFPVADFFNKELRYGGGAVDPKAIAPQLASLITRGVADPSFIVSAVIGIEQAPEYYARFDAHNETKVVIHFP